MNSVVTSNESIQSGDVSMSTIPPVAQQTPGGSHGFDFSPGFTVSGDSLPEAPTLAPLTFPLSHLSNLPHLKLPRLLKLMVMAMLMMTWNLALRSCRHMCFVKVTPHLTSSKSTILSNTSRRWRL